MTKKKKEKFWDWESPFEDLVTMEEMEQGYTQLDVDLALGKKKKRKKKK